jgi:Xaa-Pro aminopeptidase
MSLSPPLALQRLDRVRASLQLGSLDALVVTHLPNLRYLTGLAGSAGLAVVTSDACRLIVDFRYASAARGLPAALAQVVVVEVAASYDEALVEALRRTGARRIAIEAAWMPVSRFNRLSKALASTPMPFGPDGCPVLVATERIVERERAIKDADEIATLREAARRLSAMTGALGGIVRPGRTELAVAAEIDAALRGAGFERPAFDTIVASGPNSALPHARPSSRALAVGEPVVLDFGGVYDGYCVDLTRTVGLGPQTPELRRLFAAVVEAHRAALAAVRPGALPSEIDGAARASLARQGLAEAFGHGTGHGLGLEVHEEPRISRQVDGQVDAPVEPGMVFTIEPGVYVPGVGGVRIEDDVLVTEAGYELLTQVPVAFEVGGEPSGGAPDVGDSPAAHG